MANVIYSIFQTYCVVDENKVQEIIDKVEIHELMSKYELMYDRFDETAIEAHVDEFMTLFTDDCIVDYGDHGKIDGKDTLREFQRKYFDKETDFQDWFHIIANPWIEIDGEQARGRFNFFGPYVMNGVGACWQFSFYDIDFENISGEWKIDHLRLEVKYMTPYEEGWESVPIDETFTTGDSL